jgi:hypothetical protein
MDFNNVSRFTKQRYSRFQLFQFIFKENGHVVISWESKIGLGSLRVHLSINHDFFSPETPKVYSIYLSYFFESFTYIKFFMHTHESFL